jgi:hypothetical protein
VEPTGVGTAVGRPDWRDEKIGTMKRVGLWLLAEIGEGSIFTKNQLRDAFPGTSQVDRRMRDLRDFDWVIHTNREDPALDASEQRFVSQGAPVWEPGKAVRPAQSTITAAKRSEVFARDGYFCRSCGIGPGETYEDGKPETATLDIARREVITVHGVVEVELVTECKRCRVGGRFLQADAAAVQRGIAALGEMEKKIIAGWMERDGREFSAVERLWGLYRSLPAAARAELRAATDEGRAP